MAAASSAIRCGYRPSGKRCLGNLTKRFGSSLQDIGINAGSRCPRDTEERVDLALVRMLSTQIIFLQVLVSARLCPPGPLFILVYVFVLSFALGGALYRIS